jgi:hypothetical protein
MAYTNAVATLRGWARAGATSALALACSSPQESPTVFGGAGAVVDPGPAAGAVESKPSNGPCSDPAPASEHPLLEDFEDGDHRLFGAFQREGYWFGSSDDTEGGSMFPPQAQFAPAKLESDATPDNRFAAHLAASGYKDWGVSWGVTLHHLSDDAKCPLNLGEFAGLRLRARGKGAVFLRFGMPDTVSSEFGGSCADKCWDMHGYLLRSTEDWQTREVRWEQLQQGGWGAPTRFDPKRVIAFYVAGTPENLPVDVWLDDLEWIRRDDVTPR